MNIFFALTTTVALAAFGAALSFWWIRWTTLPLLGLGLGLWGRAWRPLALDTKDYFVVAFTLWACLSWTWAADGYTSALAAERLVLFSIIFILVRQVPDRAWVAYAAAGATFVTLALEIGARIAGNYPMIVDLYLNHERLPGFYGGHGNANDEAQVLLLALPLFFFVPVAGRALRWAFVGLAGASAGFLAFLTTSNQGKAVALALGLVFGIRWLIRRPFEWIFAIVATSLAAFVYAMMFPLFDYGAFYDQAIAAHLHPRLQLWIAAVNMGTDWLSGVGFGMFDLWWPEYQYVWKQFVPWATSPAFDGMVRPGAAHGDFFQLFAELGIVGLVLGVAVIVACWRGSISWAGRGGVFVACTLGLIDFPFQKPATALLATFALAICAGTSKQGPRGPD